MNGVFPHFSILLLPLHAVMCKTRPKCVLDGDHAGCNVKAALKIPK